MSIPSKQLMSLDQIIGVYGYPGRDTVLEMATKLESKSFSLKYNPETKTFTIQGSSISDKPLIVQIFWGIHGETWRPQVLEETDCGDLMVKLRSSIPHFREQNPEDIEKGGRPLFWHFQ